MFISQTYGKLKIEEIPEKLVTFYENNKHLGSGYQIVIGTDSQNFDRKTKIVNVICILCEGHGGIFFHQDERVPQIRDVRAKLYKETQDSLAIADRLVELLESDKRYEEMYLRSPIRIDIDAGNSPQGKTRDLIPGIVGWVNSLGWKCTIKPYSTAASSIADKYSKKSA